ncbi:MAG: hypothetical protein SNJ82_03880 [Gemmataceae bacterium]
MPPSAERLVRVLSALGYRPLSRLWAKIEILLGLAAILAGLCLCLPAANRESLDLLPILLGAALFLLGGYLTLAGHRSHLYQSSNERLVLLMEEIRAFQQKDKFS